MIFGSIFDQFGIHFGRYFGVQNRPNRTQRASERVSPYQVALGEVWDAILDDFGKHLGAMLEALDLERMVGTLLHQVNSQQAPMAQAIWL